MQGFDARPHVREVGWVLIAQALAIISALASLKVATNILGPADYGRFAVALGAAGIVQLCLFGAISQTASRFLFLAKVRNLLTDYFRTIIHLMLLSVPLILLSFGMAAVFGLTGNLSFPIWLLFLFLATSGCQQILLAILNAGRARKSVAFAQGIEALYRPSALAVFSFLGVPGVTMALGVYGSTAGLVAIAGLLMLREQRKVLAPGAVEPDQSGVDDRTTANALQRQMWRYTYPFVVFGVVGSLGSHGERLLLTLWVSWEQVGIYALLSQLSITPTMLLMTLINQFYLPVIFQQDPEGRADFERAFRRYLTVSLLGTVVLAVAVLLLGPWLVRLFSSKEYLGQEHLLALLVLSAGLFGMAQQLVLPGLRAMRSAIYIIPKIVHSAALLAFAYLLVPSYGLTGMALASVLTALLYLLCVVGANALSRRA